MTRAEWEGLAQLISERRTEIVRTHGMSGAYIKGAGAYERQLMRAAQLAALNDTCRALVVWLKRRSSRFDEARFMALAGCGA